MKKERMVRVIYDNYDFDALEEEARESLKSLGIENPSEEEISKEMSFKDQLIWDDVKGCLEDFLKDRVCIVKGTSGLWYGRVEGGAVIRSFSELSPAWSDCTYIRFTDVDSHFYIQCSHHDGTNYFELRELNAKGIGFLERNEGLMYKKELIETLWKNCYSRLPYYMSTVYDAPKRQAKED